jgi:molybdenum cofactor cytidylyltransferase
MGRPKALLPLGTAGRPFVGVICDVLTTAGISPIVVVTRAELRDAIAGVLTGVTLVINPDPDRGQLSSLLAGLDALGAADAVLVTLVDLPSFKLSTVTSLVSAWRDTHAPLVRPRHEDRHGHPAIFGEALLQALRSADPGPGAKPVVHRFLPAAVSVPVDDRGTVEDVDTPEAYDGVKSS